MTVIRQIMQISKPVKFSRPPGTGSQQYSKQNSNIELRLDLKFALFIPRTDQITEMIAEIKFAIINLLIHS